jgi:hypothetical protein
MEKKNSTTGTIKIDGKDIPVTKSGLPNLIYLGKSEREIVKKYKEDKKKKKQEIVIKELEDILKSL